MFAVKERKGSDNEPNKSVRDLFMFTRVQMAVTPGDQYLVTASEDGALFLWRIIDPDGRALEMVKDIDYTEEVLCTKAVLDEKVPITVPWAAQWFSGHHPRLTPSASWVRGSL